MRGPHDPIRIERAEGPWLYASDGSKILDAGGGAVVVNIGQGRREIAEVAARTIANLDYIVPVWTSPEREKLVDRLTRWTAARAHALLLHQRRIGIGRGGAEVRDALQKFRGKQSKSKSHRAPILLSRQYDCGAVGGRQRPARGLRTYSARLAEDRSDVLLSMPVGQDLSVVRYRLRRRARKRNPEARRRLDRGVHRRADDGLDAAASCRRSRSTGRRFARSARATTCC